ncbi:hypothetical protein [Butyricicoccus sp.]
MAGWRHGRFFAFFVCSKGMECAAGSSVGEKKRMAAFIEML